MRVIAFDSLNAANLRRRLDRGFVIQKAEHEVCIEGHDLKITWEYSGYCRVDGASGFDFSIDSPGTAFEDLDCRAWDLRLGAVPLDELIDGMSIPTLGFR